MSKIIGTNPNQVPANADLGSSAFIDTKEFLLSRGSSISRIDTVLNSSARRLFVYDTSNDSDGGAWRKRTKSSSWYDEELNTPTRGSRKDFPSVALIAVGLPNSNYNNVCTIYDADDPTLPMWMVFRGDSWTHGIPPTVGGTNSQITGVKALNGTVFFGNQAISGNHGSLNSINFISEKLHIRGGGGWGYNFFETVSIANRNRVSTNIIDGQSEGRLADAWVTAIDVKVLPGAPIDPETGLPIPSIAVASDNGMTIIPGRIEDAPVSLNGTSQTETIDSIAFTKDNKLLYSHGYASVLAEIPFSHDEQAYYNQTKTFIKRVTNSTTHPSDGNPYVIGGSTNHVTPMLPGKIAVASDTNGFTIVDNLESGYMHALIDNTRNSGWLMDKCEIAILNDTNIKDFHDTQDNMADNGYFGTSDLSAYTIASDEGGTVTFTQSGGEVTLTASGAGNYISRYQLIAVEAGKTYQIVSRVTASSGSNARVDCGRNGAGGTFYPSYLNNGGELFLTSVGSDGSATNSSSPVGIRTGQFVCTTSGNIRVGFRIYQNGSITCDYIIVKEIAAANLSSQNPMGLHGLGSLYKTPIGSGTDLVSYSNFSDSNHLTQPYTTAMNFGGGSYTVVFWAKSLGPGGGVIARGASDNSESMRIRHGDTTYGIYFDYGSGSQYTYLSENQDRLLTVDGKWHCYICTVEIDGFPEIYIDGIKRTNTFASTSSRTGSFFDVNTYNVYVGYEYGGAPHQGELALIRVFGKTIDSDRARKIFNDERRLFDNHARATLHGTSNVVTAMAHDESTDTLYVGTNQGRSDFQGLVRVNETDNSIEYGISAANGLVAEE